MAVTSCSPRAAIPESLGIKGRIARHETCRTLVNVASPGVYASPGWLLFMTPDQALMAQRVDPSDWTLQGTAQPVAGARCATTVQVSQGIFDASSDGRVLTYTYRGARGSTTMWFDRRARPLGRVGPERPIAGCSLSPTAGGVAVELADERIGTRDLWLMDTKTQRLDAPDHQSGRPTGARCFPRTGSSIAFASDRAGASTVFRIGGEWHGRRGGGVSVMPAVACFPSDWSRDGTC